MRIEVNGVRLFVDVEGPTLVPDGPFMRQRHTVVALHGGPGADHSILRPLMAQISDLAQVIYVDHRGNGRSDDGDPADWTLAQWGDDVRTLCDILGVQHPIVFGASFGGVVAQAYATQHPDHVGGLILLATTARTDFDTIYAAFERVGGEVAGRIARTYWSDPTPERRQDYFDVCLPLYSRTVPDPHVMQRMILKNPVAMHYNGPANEQGRFDFHDALAQVRCPALVLSGDKDPIMPPPFGERLADALPHADYHLIDGAAHLLDTDKPATVTHLIREFIKEVPYAT
ncbi:alpha/beta fold hydrolase [Tateyamaria sp. SN6-1]|uniref:alpha/beta fold hydrolase n=1 Tax=Tateyamaria sp. SN6-1 TaxID=3092148 RepID=UPI0039F45096